MRVVCMVALCVGAGCAGAAPGAKGAPPPDRKLPEQALPKQAPDGNGAQGSEDGDLTGGDASGSGGLGLSGLPLVLRDPNGPASVGTPSVEIRVGSHSVRVGGEQPLALASHDLSNQVRASLSAIRERPSAEGQGTLYALSVERGVRAASVKQIVTAAAFAGWPDAIVNKGTVALHAVVPGPPGVEPHNVPEHLRWRDEALVIIVSRDGTRLWRSAVVQVNSFGDPLEPAGDAVPTLLADLKADSSEKSVNNAVRSACSKLQCGAVALFVADEVSFAPVQVVLDALGTQAGNSVPQVELRMEEPAESLLPLSATQRLGLGQAVKGRMPKESIQAVVREAFGRLRVCYEKGLQRQPKLTGKVVVRFVIGTDGQVLAAVDIAREAPDAEFRNCVVQHIAGLRFPAPDGGIVTVVYPIRFQPAN